jgi:RND family efflux transporter MFP subunit
MRTKRLLFELVLVLVFVGIGVVVTRYLITTKPKVKRRPPSEVVLSVRVQETEVKKATLQRIADGEVLPSCEVELTPQVSGKVVYVSEHLKRGGLVRASEILIKIDDRDYRIKKAQAVAELKRQEAELARIRADHEAALREWGMLNPEEPPPALVAKEPQLKAAEAAVLAAEAALRRAELDLERTVLKAPFDALILEEHVDIGQYVIAGRSLARLACTEEAQIRVFLSETETRGLRIPGFNTATEAPGSGAVIETTIGGRTYHWRGQIVRAEPVDTQTRRVPVMVLVKEPYRKVPPLAFGLYVKVVLLGPELPKAALVSKRTIEWTDELKPFVWVVDSSSRARKRKVRIDAEYDKEVLITQGLKEGELVILDPPVGLTDGTKVKPIKERKRLN